MNKKILKRNLIIIGIHNNNERYQNLKNSIENLAFLLSDVIESTVYFHRQSDYKYISIYRILNRWINQFILESNYRINLKTKPFFIPRIIKLIIRILMLIRNKENIDNTRLKIYREMALTKKHLMALEYFLNTTNAFAIILEDDAIVEHNTFLVDKFKAILTGEHEYLYIDLAGGLDNIMINQKKYANYVKKDINQLPYLITNTTCAYLMNRRLASFVIDYIFYNNKITNQHPIDWIYNKIFIKLQKQKIVFSNYHFFKKFIRHGSKSGDYFSSIQFNDRINDEN